MDRVRPHNPPNSDKKWHSIEEKLKSHKEYIDRVVEMRIKEVYDNGFKNHNLRSLIRIGYSLALEDNDLDDWNK